MLAGILILGEHDKGFGEPFSLKTVSGRRLRTMVAELNLDVQFGNVFDYCDGRTSARDLRAAYSKCHIVVAVGKVASAECARQGIEHRYLPHPAVRTKAMLDQLRDGLRRLKEPGVLAGE